MPSPILKNCNMLEGTCCCGAQHKYTDHIKTIKEMTEYIRKNFQMKKLVDPSFHYLKEYDGNTLDIAWMRKETLSSLMLIIDESLNVLLEYIENDHYEEIKNPKFMDIVIYLKKLCAGMEMS